jgi:tetratricopeptide (TPR) repeat protein
VSEYYVQLLQRRALAYSLLGAFDKSISDFKYALSSTPNAGSAVFSSYVNLVMVHLKIGNVPEAESAIREWIERDHDQRAERIITGSALLI